MRSSDRELQPGWLQAEAQRVPAPSCSLLLGARADGIFSQIELEVVQPPQLCQGLCDEACASWTLTGAGLHSWGKVSTTCESWHSGQDQIRAQIWGAHFASGLEAGLSNYNFDGLTNRKI